MKRDDKVTPSELYRNLAHYLGMVRAGVAHHSRFKSASNP